ncbi:MAG TPA: hypothetical protein VF530_11070 [Planctomycetota bacterium]
MAIAALLTLLALVQEPVPFRDLHADGKTPEEVGARLTLPDGRVVLHGPYERFHRNGKSAARGEYALGLRTGAWELRHEDGKMRARGEYVRGLEQGPWVEFHERTAKKASEGSYRAGLRTGKWTFWDRDGKKKDFPSGEWKVVEAKDAGKVRSRGAQIEGTKDGPWLHLWPNGAAQFVARFELGRLDELFFLHPDGTLDPKWLSRKSLPRELPEWAEPFVAGLPREDLPLQVTPAARARVAEWLASGAEPVEPALLAEPREHAPAAVEALRACALDTEEGLSRARRLHGLLRQLFGGVGWDWSDKEAALLARRWGSAWELLRDEDVLWQVDFDPRWRWLGHDLGSSALLRPPGLEELRDGGGRFGGRLGGARAPFPKETLARAAAWLVAQQDARDLWRGERGDEVADSALVLLVLLGDGHSHRTGEHAAAVQRGLLALRARLAEPGALAGVRAHALVTWLHAELYDIERAPGLSLIVREHAGALLERLGEDGRFAPDALEDALARFTLAYVASGRHALDEEELARLLATSADHARSAREAALPGPAARTLVGVGLLAQLFGGPRPAPEVLVPYAEWLERHPPDAQTPPEETVFGAWAAMQLGKPAAPPWIAALEGPLRSGWQADGAYKAQRTAVSRLEATCLAALTLQCWHRWPVILAQR